MSAKGYIYQFDRVNYKERNEMLQFISVIGPLESSVTIEVMITIVMLGPTN